MAQENVPVLIVGGGIVGLSASLFLSHHGIHSLLVERHPGTSIHPRARGFNTRTMELYRGIGLEDAIRNAGEALQPAAGFFKGATLREALEGYRPEQRQRMVAASQQRTRNDEISPTTRSRGPQDLVEPILLASARARGEKLCFSTEMISFEQDEAGVIATVRDRLDGRERTVRAEYMLAADGVRSPVRHALAIPRSQSGSEGHMLNLLIQADLSTFVRGREFSMCMFERPEMTALLTSINNSDLWAWGVVYSPEKGETPEQFSPGRCKELIHLSLGFPAIEIEIKSILPVAFAGRVAQTYQKGRVFLAGDAVHQMPPWAGLGANTGIADAHNLAWKLALVLKGVAAPALLDTYTIERQPIGMAATELSLSRSDERGLLSWERLMAPMREKDRQLGDGYGFKYTSSAIATEENDDPENVDLNGQPGTRLPHLWIEYQGKRISTIDLPAGGLILLTGPAGDAWCEAAHLVAMHQKVELQVYRIAPDGDLRDAAKLWPEKAGIKADGALLVRPDGFVAWRSREMVANPQALLGNICSRHIECTEDKK